MPDENKPESNAPAKAAPSAAGPAQAAPLATPPAAPVPKPRRRVLRTTLLVLGPVVVLAGALYAYLTTGRFIGTDNAYVKADVGIVSARIAGPIVEIDVHENQAVAQGDVLFRIDDTSFKVNLDRADAQLGAIHDYVEGIRASYHQALEQLELDKSNAAFERREYDRLRSLAERKLASGVDVDEAHHKSDVADLEVVVALRNIDRVRAQLGGDPDRPLTEQSAFLAAKSIRDAAVLDMEHTIVRAPFNGVASKVPMVGHYAAPGAPLMTVISNGEMWIEANYKETDLTHVEVGQPVSIKLDTYPDREWRGKVQSISQATGAEFSVIPAQNATGNWVKVAQRIPVRISIQTRGDDPELRVGMSAEIEIDTGYERPAPSFLTGLRPDHVAEAAPAREHR